jgi:hypothetical protein
MPFESSPFNTIIMAIKAPTAAEIRLYKNIHSFYRCLVSLSIYKRDIMMTYVTLNEVFL